MLDQRISRQRADDVDALAGRLEAGRQAGKRATIFAGEFDPDGFDETARWLRSGARDDPVAADRLLPVPGVEYQFAGRSEEHTSELQSLMRISYAVFCLK